MVVTRRAKEIEMMRTKTGAGAYKLQMTRRTLLIVPLLAGACAGLVAAWLWIG